MTPEDRERYSRQIRYEGIGEAGQQALLASQVAIVGCGALGTFHAGALARAGVGRLVLIDRDFVELSNLQRQWLYEESDAAEGLPKAVAAQRRLNRINSGCVVEAAVEDLVADNIEDLLAGCALILDGTDNFETRYLINDFAVAQGVPWIYGAAVGSYGIAMPVLPGVTSCLACVYPSPPTGAQPTCETAGVLGTVTAMVAAAQVAMGTKVLCGAPVEPRITTFDVWSGAMRQIAQPRRDADCRVCGRHEYTWLRERRRAPISLCGRNAVQIHERARPIDLVELKQRLSGIAEVRANEFALRFYPRPYEMTVFPDGRAIIKGTTDTGVARSLYARYIGG